MTDTTPRVPPLTVSRVEQVFPTLTPSQIERIAVHGRVRPVTQGEVLVEAGDHVVPFFVVTAGQVEVVQPGSTGETLIALHGPGRFSGEATMISGRQALFRARVRESGEVIEVDREHLVALVQTDAQLGEILMRAFILRRVELVASGLGDAVLIGSALELNSPGGQAGSSSRIENYLGFPAGISGQDLAGRAYVQAQKFGAQVMIAKGATRLRCHPKPYAVGIDDGPFVPARAIIVATGAEYRRPALENLAQFESAGVYYAATFVEAQVCSGEEVIVVGGANSAGQAAVFLAQTTRRVHMLVRSGSLAGSMSRYLIRRIEENPAIVLHTHTEIVALEGSDHLEHVRWRDNLSGRVETHDISHVFVMAGAVPNTGWLNACLALDGKGFIKTGPELSPDDLHTARWPLARRPHMLETSVPGVFAVGDVRGGNIKRVASAVGEGAIAVSFVHQALRE